MGVRSALSHKAPLLDESHRWINVLLSLGQEDPLEEEMSSHSNVLSWKTSWTEEHGRLQSMGLQRVGHD